MNEIQEIIKCNKCGQVLISGRGMMAIFGSGTSIECRKCGNKYVFGQTESTEAIKDS